MTGVEIAEHDRRDLPTLVAVATRAFWDDPLFNFFAPDLLVQHRAMPGFFMAGIGDCSAHGRVWTAKVDGTIAGVAAWLPPGVHVPTKGRRALVQTRHAAPTILRSSNRRAAMALMNEMPKHHLRDPHWYLEVLATDPKYQGRGVGKALLEPVLAVCDAEGLPAYLETQKESNLAYYARFRFEVTEILRVRDAPPIWTMTRQPE